MDCNDVKLRVRMNACSILCANARMLSAWLTVLRKHERQHQFHMHFFLLSIERITYWEISLSGLQRRARHTIAHDELLQMGSYGTHGAVSSTKKIHIRHLCGPIRTSLSVHRLQAHNEPDLRGCSRVFDAWPNKQKYNPDRSTQRTNSHQSSRMFLNILLVLSFEMPRF